MRVTITVENGDQDVEITRHATDVHNWSGDKLTSVGPVLDLAADDVRRACGIHTRTSQGRCGKTMPHLEGDLATYCALPHGHVGWHRNDDGQEMGEGW